MDEKKTPKSKSANKAASNENAAAANAGKVLTLPVVDREPEEKKAQTVVGLFSPSIVNLPTDSEILQLLSLLLPPTRPITASDREGNLLDENKNVVIPNNLTKFFRVVPVSVPA